MNIITSPTQDILMDTANIGCSDVEPQVADLFDVFFLFFGLSHESLFGGWRGEGLLWSGLDEGFS